MNSQNGVARANIKEDGLVESLRSSAKVGGKSRSTDVLQDGQIDVLTAGEEEGGHRLILEDQAGIDFFSGNNTWVYHNADVAAFYSFIGNAGF